MGDKPEVIIAMINTLANKEETARRIEKNAQFFSKINRQIENFGDREKNNFTEDFYKIRDDVKSKLNSQNAGRFEYENLVEINENLEKLYTRAPVVEIENFGEQIQSELKFSRYWLPTDKIGTALVQFNLKENFNHSNSDNLLASIWLEFIGEKEIPSDRIKLQELITLIQNKFQMERHINHWKKEFEKAEILEKFKKR